MKWFEVAEIGVMYYMRNQGLAESSTLVAVASNSVTYAIGDPTGVTELGTGELVERLFFIFLVGELLQRDVECCSLVGNALDSDVTVVKQSEFFENRKP